MKRLFCFLSLLPALGLVSLYRLALYRIGLKIGHYRRALPIKKYDAGLGLIFNCGPSDGRKFEVSEILLKRVDAMLEGELLLFSHWAYHFQGYPDWHLDPVNQLNCRQDLHWTQTEVPSNRDTKCFWGMPRFEWAPTLARAWLTDS